MKERGKSQVLLYVSSVGLKIIPNNSNVLIVDINYKHKKYIEFYKFFIIYSFNKIKLKGKLDQRVFRIINKNK